MPGDRGDALQLPQPRRGRGAGDVEHRQAVLGAAHRVQLPQDLKPGLRLPGVRPVLGGRARQGSDDQTVERGDIVVNEERAKELSQPRFDAKGKPVKPEAGRGAPKNAATAAAAAADSTENAPAPAVEDKPADAPGKRKVRAVGPNFYPVR